MTEDTTEDTNEVADGLDETPPATDATEDADTSEGPDEETAPAE